MTIPWEAGKEYTLRNGLRVKIDATDRGGGFPIHGAFLSRTEKYWVQSKFGLSGENSNGLNDYDLLPPAPPRIKGECWLVVKANRNMSELVAGSKNEAKRLAELFDANNGGPCAIIHVPYDVAEGDWL